MKKTASIVLAIGCIFAVILVVQHRAKGQDNNPAAISSPTEIIDQMMNKISQGKFDDAVSLMDGFKNQADLQQDTRTKLLALRDDQGPYRGYDLAAVQKFTPQFEKVEAMVYYDNQPVLFRFHFYRQSPQNGGKWAILALQIQTTAVEIDEVLKDSPVDYVSRK